MAKAHLQSEGGERSIFSCLGKIPSRRGKTVVLFHSRKKTHPGKILERKETLSYQDSMAENKTLSWRNSLAENTVVLARLCNGKNRCPGKNP